MREDLIHLLEYVFVFTYVQVYSICVWRSKDNLGCYFSGASCFLFCIYLLLVARKLSNRPGKLASGSQESTCLSSFLVLGYKYVPPNLEFCSLSLSFSLTLVVAPLFLNL